MRGRLGLVLLLLLAGCATPPPLPLQPVTVAPPSIPPLPPEARQPPAPEFCLPTCSSWWKKQVEQWQKKLTSGA